MLLVAVLVAVQWRPVTGQDGSVPVAAVVSRPLAAGLQCDAMFVNATGF